MNIFENLTLKLSSLGRFWQQKTNNLLFRWNIMFIIFQLVYLLFRFNDLPVSVPMFYSLPWGDSRLAPASMLFLLPGLSIIIMLTNSLLAAFLLGSVELFSYLLLTFSLIFSGFSFWAILNIINLVT